MSETAPDPTDDDEPVTGPCVWFEAIGDDARECEHLGDAEVKLDYKDDTGEVTETLRLLLCQKHIKRLTYEAGGMAVPDYLLDDELIHEEPLP